MLVLCISLRARLPLLLALLHSNNSKCLALDSQPDNLLRQLQELEQPEQVQAPLELVQAWEPNLTHSEEWAAWEAAWEEEWEACPCSQVWLQAVDPLAWVVWVAQARWTQTKSMR